MISTENYTVNYTSKQLVLPMDIGTILPKDSEVHTYLELTKGINLENYFNSPNHLGRIRKNRVQILHAILFGFMIGERSTREIEKSCKYDTRFMYLIQDLNPPSHTLINEVMKEVGDRLDGLLLEINQEIMKRDSIDMDTLYIDGTKIEADANKYSFVWKKSVEKHLLKLQIKITKLFKDANIVLSEYEIPKFKVRTKYRSKHLSRYENKLIQLIDCLGIELVYGKGKRKTEIQRIYDELVTYRDKLKEYETHLRIIGPNRNSYAKTDHDATFMHMKEDHMRNAQLKPGYNVQIGVSNEYIMVIEAYQNGGDQLTFEPILEKYNLMYDRYPRYPVADAGYGSYDNYTYCIEHGMELYQKYNTWEKERTRKHQRDIYHKDNFSKDEAGNYLCPIGRTFYKVKEYQSKYIRHQHTKIQYECESCAGCPVKTECTKAKNNRIISEIDGHHEMKEVVKENLASELGIKLRTQRSIQVEGAFGVIKEDMKFRRFTRTMFSGIKLELNLIAIGYNLKKYHNKKYRIIN